MGVQTWCNLFLSKSTAEALTISQYMSNHFKQGGERSEPPCCTRSVYSIM